ncbi:beta family protein [Candidatus Avelusimicrobium sp.]|uniref:beta family protein n=1 Tax=Candidatus Avelusimicrobium sp. TaxID=3048833 RepID=UPI003F8001E8
MTNKYIPIIKMGDAELKGVGKLLDSVKDSITPVFELTRSRKTGKLKEGSIFRRLDKLEEVFGTKRSFVLDLTSDSYLINTEIQNLQDSAQGYLNWCDFVLKQKDRFPGIIPMIQISEDENLSLDENNQNLAQQVSFLKQNFQTLFYRINIDDEIYEEDLEIITKTLGDRTNSLVCCIDAVFIPREKASSCAQNIVKKVTAINNRFGITQFSLAGTSFPQTVTQISTENTADIFLEEVECAQQVAESFRQKKDISIIYGDYASINQKRNDMITSGWIPRIDCPTKELIFYYKKRRDGEAYAQRYMEVANMVVRDSRFQQLKNQINCWGIDEIEYAAKHKPRGLAPSFWISVRLNIHISLRSFLLNSSNGANFSS